MHIKQTFGSRVFAVSNCNVIAVVRCTALAAGYTLTITNIRHPSICLTVRQASTNALHNNSQTACCCRSDDTATVSARLHQGTTASMTHGHHNNVHPRSLPAATDIYYSSSRPHPPRGPIFMRDSCTRRGSPDCVRGTACQSVSRYSS